MPKRGGGKGRKKPKLYDLTKERLTVEQIIPYYHELIGANDRTCALTGAGAVDQLLIEILRQHFIDADADPDEEADTALFEPGGFLSTFSSRITLCYLLGVISGEAKARLHAISRVRNVFAHRVQYLAFSHPLVAAECAKLGAFDDPVRLAAYGPFTPRQQFYDCVMDFSVVLYRWLNRDKEARIAELTEERDRLAAKATGED